MVTVTFNAADLAAFGADIHAGIHILEGLKKAGVPVIGTLLPLGVREGTLTMLADEKCVTYAWAAPEEAEEESLA